MKHNRNIQLARILSLPGLIIGIAASGCALLRLPVEIVDVTLNTNMSGINTPPSTKWRAGPDFNPNEFPIIAIYVMSVGNTGHSGNVASIERTIEDEFIGNLLQKGYRIVARSEDLEKLNAEKVFAKKSGDTVQDVKSDKEIMERGRMANAPAILIVKINDAAVKMLRTEGMQYFQASCTVSARLHAVGIMEQKGQSLFTSKRVVSHESDILPAVIEASKCVSDSIPKCK